MSKLGVILGLSLLATGISAEHKVQQVKTNAYRSTSDHMSKSEREFADLLSPLQKEIFTMIFNDQQREHAMEIFHADKGSMSADAAVEKVLSVNRDPKQDHRSMMKKQSDMDMMKKSDMKKGKDDDNKRSYYY